MGEVKHTPGPWSLCTHLQSIEQDRACPCGFRGVVWGPEHDRAMAICQPGCDPETPGQEGLGPQRYPREVELANARLIAAAPDLLEALCEMVAAEDEYEGFCENDERCKSARAQARAAIAKAEASPNA